MVEINHFGIQLIKRQIISHSGDRLNEETFYLYGHFDRALS